LDDRGLTLSTPRRRAQALIRRYDSNHDGKLQFREWQRSVGKQSKPRFAGFIADALPPGKTTLMLADLESYYARHHPYLALESKQLLLPPEAERAAREAAKALSWKMAPTLVYLARMQHGRQTVTGVVAALDPTAAAPLGPFLPPGVESLENNQIV